MNLNSIDIAIRNRTNWEAFDLGKPLLFRYKKEVYLPWITGNSIFFIVIFGAFYSKPLLAMFLMWLSLPLTERLVLFVLSRAVFGEIPNYRQTMRQWLPQLKNGIFSYNWGWRFLANRSLYLAVWQLEGLKGKQRRKRLGQIGHNAGSTAFWEGSIFALIEQLLALSMVALVLFFVPEGVIIWDDIILESLGDTLPVWMLWLSATVYWLVVILLRPLYVAGGFTLYLHRRMVLEGWDIELQFRSLAQRLNNSAVLMLVSLVFFLTPAKVQAETEAKQQIEEILAQEEFETKKEVTVRKFIDEGESSSWDLSFLSGLGGFFKVFFVVFILALLGWLIYKIVTSKSLKFSKSEDDVEENPPEVKEVMGLNLTEESLPADIGEEVSRLISQEKFREALSLLYRASLFHFVNYQKVRLKKSFTENDCLAAVKQQAESSHQSFFEKLTGKWIQLAYGHQVPAADDLRSFNQEWQKHFTLPAKAEADK